MRVMVQPESTLAIERQLLPNPQVFSFSYQDRRFRADQPESIAYDRRYVDLYHPERVWIVGWWNTYFGWVYHPYPVHLHLDRPFHHPWLVVNEAGTTPQPQEQRQPIRRSERNRAMYSVLITDTDDPPTDWLLPEGMVFDLPAIRVTGTGPDPRELPYPQSPLTDAFMRLPVTLIGGMCKRRAYEPIAAWMQWASRWLTDHATELADDYDLDRADDLPFALYTLSQETILYPSMESPADYPPHRLEYAP